MRRQLAAGIGALMLALATTLPLPVPAMSAASSCTGWESTVDPPRTINVLRTALGRVDRVPFREYVEAVLAAEWGPTNPPEALAAGAVAVKQYGWYYALAGHWRGGSLGGRCFDVRDTNVDQVYAPAVKRPTKRHLRAVERSWDVTLRKINARHPKGRFFLTGYNGGGAFPTCGARATGWDLWQRGATDCARRGYRFTAILRAYYGPDLRVVSSRPRHDLDGDGYGDLATVVDVEQGGAADAFVHRSGGRAFEPATRETLWFGGSDALGWVRTDLTGDDRDELAILVATDLGLRISVFRMTDAGFAGETWWDGAGEGTRLGSSDLRFVGGDWDGDGRADLGIIAPVPGEPERSRFYELRSTGSGLESPEKTWEGAIDARRSTILAGDVTGDGRADLVDVEARGARGTALRVIPSRPGGGWGKLADWYVDTGLARADALPVLADVDDDGRDDLVILARTSTNGTVGYLFRATATRFQKRTVWRPDEPFTFTDIKAGAADLDRDGRDDLFLLVRSHDPGRGTDLYALVSRGSSLKEHWWGSSGYLVWSRASTL